MFSGNNDSNSVLQVMSFLKKKIVTWPKYLIFKALMNLKKLVKLSYCVFVEIIKLELISMIYGPSSSRKLELICNIALMSYNIIGTVLTVAFSIVELELVGNFVLFDLGSMTD